MCGKKIDFVWFSVLTFDRLTNFPYTMTVIDLEHLKQSFFPEWGKKINWYRRNNKLSDFLKNQLLL